MTERASRLGRLRPARACLEPVAELCMAGSDAVNLAPGDPRYAHSDDERVSPAALARAYDIVSSFLAEEA